MRYLPLLGAFLAALTAGCGNELGTVPVTGVVLYNGKPVDLANITFLREGDQGPAAIAVTGEDGRFELKTGKHSGAVPGRYKVLVQKDTSAYFKIPDPLPDGMTRTGYMMANNLIPSSLLPEKYASLQDTPLVVEVGSDAKKNYFEIKLEGTVPKPPKPDPRLKSRVG